MNHIYIPAINLKLNILKQHKMVPNRKIKNLCEYKFFMGTTELNKIQIMSKSN